MTLIDYPLSAFLLALELTLLMMIVLPAIRICREAFWRIRAKIAAHKIGIADVSLCHPGRLSECCDGSR